MLILVTGAPGSGKTLWTIPEVERLRKESSRPVFYFRIPELVLPWTELTDPKLWHEAPSGAIIVIDEAHKLFPQRPAGSQAPAHVAPFDEHRHKGHDVFLLTQHPNELDHYVRRRIGRHVHFERKFGVQRSRKFEWQKLGDPEDFHSKKEAIGSEFRFPQEVFALYKSADLHTVKPALPWRKLLPIAVWTIIGVCAAVFAIHNFTSGIEKSETLQTTDTAAQATQAALPRNPALEATTWSARFIERVEGIPYSAPIYDTTFSPVTFPKISGCMEIRVNTRTRCSCNTQQGTLIHTMTVKQCQFWLKNGWFDPTRSDQDQSGGAAASPEGPPQAAGGQPAGPAAAVGLSGFPS